MNKFALCVMATILASLTACTGSQTRVSSDDQKFSSLSPMEQYQAESLRRRQVIQSQIRTLVQNESDIIHDRGQAFENRAEQAVEGYSQSNTDSDIPLPLQDESLPLDMVDTDSGKLFYRASLKYHGKQYAPAADDFLLAFQFAQDKHLKCRSLYWLSECHYRNKEWDRAIKLFTYYEDEYGYDELMPNVLLKKSFSLIKAKRTLEAQQMFSRILKEFPDSPEAKIASEQLKTTLTAS